MQEQVEEPIIIRRKPGKLTPELYFFNESIPAFKVIHVPRGFEDPPVRYTIMRLLSKGIDESANIQGKTLRRHTLSAREIKQLLKEHENPEVNKISYTNLYFHLNKLLEIGAIKIVAYVIERSHRIAYYGRTAQVILKRNPETEFQKYQELFTEFSKLAKLLQPDIDTEKITALAEKYYSYMYKRREEIAQWLADRAAIIQRENLDFLLIDKFLLLLDTLNPEYRTILGELSDFIP
ncbi:MAG: hypothetical protein ACFFD4_32820 [Candidatus Odinarchaeota archaeon]